MWRHKSLINIPSLSLTKQNLDPPWQKSRIAYRSPRFVQEPF